MAKCFVNVHADDEWICRIEVTHAAIEEALNVKLDRRRSYLVDHFDGMDRKDAEGNFRPRMVQSLGTFTGPCSGCSGDYESGTDGPVGAGCHECGFTGKRVTSMFIGDEGVTYLDGGDQP